MKSISLKGLAAGLLLLYAGAVKLPAACSNSIVKAQLTMFGDDSAYAWVNGVSVVSQSGWINPPFPVVDITSQLGQGGNLVIQVVDQFSANLAAWFLVTIQMSDGSICYVSSNPGEVNGVSVWTDVGAAGSTPAAGWQNGFGVSNASLHQNDATIFPNNSYALTGGPSGLAGTENVTWMSAWNGATDPNSCWCSVMYLNVPLGTAGNNCDVVGTCTVSPTLTPTFACPVGGSETLCPNSFTRQASWDGSINGSWSVPTTLANLCDNQAAATTGDTQGTHTSKAVMTFPNGSGAGPISGVSIEVRWQGNVTNSNLQMDYNLDGSTTGLGSGGAPPYFVTLPLTGPINSYQTDSFALTAGGPWTWAKVNAIKVMMESFNGAIEVDYVHVVVNTLHNACSSPTISLTPSFNPSQTATPTRSPTRTWTPTPSPSRTPTATPTPTATYTRTTSPTASATVTPTPTPSVTFTESPTPSPTRTATPTATRTPTPTASSSVTFTSSPTLTPSWTPTATQSITFTGSPTLTPTRTPSPTPSATSSVTFTMSLTATPSRTPTATQSITFTSSPTPSLSRTPTVTLTASPSVTFTPSASFTPSLSATATLSPSRTATSSSTPTATQSITFTGSPTLSSTRTSSSTPSVTSSVTFTLSCTATPTWTSTATQSITFTDSPTLTPTRTPSSTATVTSSVTFTLSATSTPSASSTPSPTATATLSPTWTPTATQSITFTDSPTATETWTETLTATSTPTASFTPTWTPSFTQSITYTGSPSASPSLTVSPISTAAPSFSSTPSASFSPTGTLSGTPSVTSTASLTESATRTPSPTPSATASPSPSFSRTASPTPPGSPTWTPSATLTPLLSGYFSLKVFNAAGELVRQLAADEAALAGAAAFNVLTPAFAPLSGQKAMIQAGGRAILWDGTNDNGSPVASGGYWLQYERKDAFGAVTTLILSISVLESGGSYQVRIFNSAGEVVRDLSGRQLIAGAAPSRLKASKGALESSPGAPVIFDLGSGTLSWDGRGADGRRLASGVYSVQLSVSPVSGGTWTMNVAVTLLASPGSPLGGLLLSQNPWRPRAHSRLIISSSAALVQLSAGLYNLAGELILQASVAQSGSLSLEALPGRTASGVYLLLVQGQDASGNQEQKALKLCVLN